MQCPKCGFTTAEKLSHCPQCGFSLVLLETFSRLRESVAGTNAGLQKICRDMQEITQKIDLLEKDLRNIPPPKETPPVQQKTEPRQDISSEMKAVQMRLHQKALETEEKERLSKMNTASPSGKETHTADSFKTVPPGKTFSCRKLYWGDSP